MKKIFLNILSAILSFAFLLPIAGCKEEDTQSTNDNSSSSTEAAPSGYLALSTYNVKLKVGETLSLGVKRYNDKDEEQEIESLQLISENSLVASATNDGTITAVQAGETYVNVEADGVEAAVFVTVQSANAVSGLVIRFSSEELYLGMPSQARAVILEEGELVANVENVAWSVEGGALEITETGLVTPKELTDNATVKASCEYGGKTYTAEIQIAVVEPLYYALTSSNVKLADKVTLSGEDNDSYTSTRMQIKEINALSGEIKNLDETEIEIAVTDESVATVSVIEGETIELQTVAKGTTTVSITVKETGKEFLVPLEVATSIGTIADMDALALSVYNEEQRFLLADSYILVNDIDYQGDVIMPITTSVSSTAHTDYQAGVQWKYRLKKTDSGYAWVDRAEFGKAGTGLTDEEFKTFAKLHKTLFHVPFKGTFDGNGYAIKNAAIFYGQWVSCNPAKPWSSSNLGIFGVLSGTLKNIGFENITVQNPADYLKGAKYEMELSEYGLDRVYTNDGAFEDGRLAKDGAYYKANSYSLVCKSNAGALIENVYFHFKKGLGDHASGQTGTLLSWGTQTTVRNCVLYVEDLAQSGRLAMGDSRADTKSVFSNNLILGMSNFHYNDQMNVLGQNGNWWLGSKKKLYEWKDLFTLEASEEATAVRTVAEVVETFDTKVWDMYKFGANRAGRPKLINGCSVSNLPTKIEIGEIIDDPNDKLLVPDKEWQTDKE